jgi:hypothetical protein
MLNFLPDFPRNLQRFAKKRLAQWLCLFLIPCATSWAKDPPITGILLYGSGSTLAYVQVTGFTINEKTELRACSRGGPIDKSTYKSLAKMNVAGVSTLERLSDGSLAAEVNGAPPACVVPGNFKYDKETSLSQSDLAGKSVFAGQVTGSSGPSPTALPAFAIGAKFIFGSSTDKELAEYYLAGREKSIATWQIYLAQYPSSRHLAQAKVSLAALLLEDGNRKLDQYKASRGSSSPPYDLLKSARERGDQAFELQASNDATVMLRDAVRAELNLLSASAMAKLQAFRDAEAAHVAGYPQLVAAKDLSDQIALADPKFAPGIALASAVNTETHALDTTVQLANTQITAGRFDAAFATTGRYVSFSAEEPRLKQIVAAVYKYHIDKANSEVSTGNWTDAVADFKLANNVLPTEEAKNGLTNAQAGLLTAQNKQAADRALAISKQRTDDKDAIGAYEILANLTDAQRLLAKDQMSALQDPYVAAAIADANHVQTSHIPMHGRNDEDAVRETYEHLLRASKLSDDPAIPIKLDLMADTIANYYVAVASKYLSKPLSSGVGLGWTYLNEAAEYRPNMDVIHDARTTNEAAYRMRAKLSIGVALLDQTSLRDSAGFADQMSQALEIGLENSPDLAVKVVLGSSAIEPNFRIRGEILEHSFKSTVKKRDTLRSQYRNGTQEDLNQDWNKADLVYSTAQSDLEKAQGTLTASQTKNNKKLTEAAEQALSARQEVVMQARSKLNSTPKTLTHERIDSYNYTRTTLEVTNIVHIAFRIKDAGGSPIGDQIDITKGDQPKTFIILDGIKPDDTQGVKQIDTDPDQKELMREVENETREALVRAAHDRVQDLPKRILSQAKSQATSDDIDDAGEAYVLYLNSVPATSTPERNEAVHYLYDHFNIRNTDNLRAGGQ